MINILEMRAIASKMESLSNLANAHNRGLEASGLLQFTLRAIEEMSAAIRDVAKELANHGDRQ